MNKTGICSVSFRENSPEEVLRAAALSGLDGIEWGSDVHVRPDNLSRAREIRNLTESAGLKTLSYGTYFGVDGLDIKIFTDYLKVADILETDILRIWPPTKSLEQSGKEEYQKCVRFMQEVATQAEMNNKTVCFECHPHTLTEKASDAVSFIRDIGKENVKMYWQPNQFRSVEENVTNAKELSKLVTCVHTFNWRNNIKLPLCEGISQWKRYVSAISSSGTDHTYLLEFIHDDEISSIVSEVYALNQIINR